MRNAPRRHARRRTEYNISKRAEPQPQRIIRKAEHAQPQAAAKAGRFSAERDWSSCNRRWSWAARAGALGGARCETNGRPRAQYAPEPSVPEPPVPYLAARSSRSSSRWPQLIAPSLPAFSVNRESLSSRRTRIPPLLSLHATSPQNYGRRRSTTCGGEFPAGSSPDCRLPDLL